MSGENRCLLNRAFNFPLRGEKTSPYGRVSFARHLLGAGPFGYCGTDIPCKSPLGFDGSRAPPSVPRSLGRFECGRRAQSIRTRERNADGVHGLVLESFLDRDSIQRASGCDAHLAHQTTRLFVTRRNLHLGLCRFPRNFYFEISPETRDTAKYGTYAPKTIVLDFPRNSFQRITRSILFEFQAYLKWSRVKILFFDLSMAANYDAYVRVARSAKYNSVSRGKL